MNTNKALIIVDAQRGFMPETEGQRLNLPGFGELGVTDGEKIVNPINKLTEAFRDDGQVIATTQDWHPTTTAHFAKEPNFVNTWPVHCVGGTPGAELHPDLLVAHDETTATRFIKGDVPARTPEEDTSYTGALAYNPETRQQLPDFLRQRGVATAYIVGLALGDGKENKLCVDSTAADLLDAGFNVTLVTDATEAVLPENRAKCFCNLGKKGVKLAITAEILEEIVTYREA